MKKYERKLLDNIYLKSTYGGRLLPINFGESNAFLLNLGNQVFIKNLMFSAVRVKQYIISWFSCHATILLTLAHI